MMQLFVEFSVTNFCNIQYLLQRNMSKHTETILTHWGFSNYTKNERSQLDCNKKNLENKEIALVNR
jgi:hypothetical protein